MSTLERALVAMLLAIIGTVASAQGIKPTTATPSRGELLYENHCTACHESKAHLRGNRRATSVKEVEGWVRRWSTEQKLGWGDEEIQAVTRHLARRYYKFDVPAERN